MTVAVEMITFDCAEPDSLAKWWADAAGGELIPVMPDEFVVVATKGGPKLGFQKVPDPTPGKNRVHVDFTAPDVEAEVARLVDLGAAETGRHSFGEFSWVVMADPDGNAFCVAAEDTVTT
jgi:hypothetical protein